jgi:hypothetical protein
MPTVTEALAAFEQKASAARARYHRAVQQGTSPREAQRVHDEARQRAFNDLVAQVQDRQRELTTLLDGLGLVCAGSVAPGTQERERSPTVITSQDNRCRTTLD